MTNPADEPDDPPEQEDEEAPQRDLNPQRGKRRRRKLQRWLDDEDDLLSGTTDLMQATEPTAFEHRVVFDGAGLTRRGGPAREVLALVSRLVEAVKGLVPEAEPGLASLVGGNSIEITLYASDREVAEAIARRASATEDEDDDGVVDDDGDDDVEIDAEALPDTSLAVVVLTEILRFEDPEDAARAVLRISVGAADGVRDLAVTLADRDVRLVVDAEEERVEAAPDWSLSVVEHLDASSEEPPARVEVKGVLAGARARGEGEFEIETDADVPLDPRVGSRMKAGDVVKGALTQRAIQEIRRHNLWNAHVLAQVEVRRRRRGGRLRVEGRRLMSVRPRFRDQADGDLPDG